MRINPTLFETFPRVWKHPSSTIKPVSSPLATVTSSAPFKARHLMGSTSRTTEDMSKAEFVEYGVETTQLNPAPGVELSESQKLLTGSVLDLFAGRPTVKKLSLWTDDATFTDPLTIAEGRKQYSAQWYGLQAAFSDIQRLSLSVLSAGNPIELDLKTLYKLKGLGTEQTIASKVKIHYDESSGKITKVEDRWNDELPDGAFKNALRNLNSVVVPAFVSVPKSEEEEAKKQAGQ